MRDHYYDRKKSSSRLSGGYAIVIMTEKKVLVVCLAGAKKDPVICLADARSKILPEKKKIQSSGAVHKVNYDRKKGTVVWLAMFFEPPEKNTTRKKRYSRLTNG